MRVSKFPTNGSALVEKSPVGADAEIVVETDGEIAGNEFGGSKAVTGSSILVAKSFCVSGEDADSG